ncbi:MAG: ComEA family DNA-binding protein [Anaerotignaceae bacterium]
MNKVMEKPIKFLIISLVVIMCSLWYSIYNENEKISFEKNEVTYYNSVEMKNEFSNILYEETVVNINTATQEELTELPNIGPATANAIIEYRSINGDFSSIEEITKVKGIGDSTFDALKDRINVE